MMRRRPYHHGDLRSALLERGARMLRERGADALSLRELARELCVSHAAPSRHFKDKRALLDALAVAGFERLNGELEQAIASGEGFLGKLRAAAEAYTRFAVTDAALLDVMYAGKHAPDVSAELAAAAAKMGAAPLELILEGQRSGDVRTDDPGRVGMVLLAGLHGYASLRASGLIPPDDDALDNLVEDLVRAIRP